MKLILAAIIVLAVIGGGFYWLNDYIYDEEPGEQNNQTPTPIPPPTPQVPEGWKLITDNAIGISFHYPEAFGTKYIHEQDWPPKVQVVDAPFICTEGGRVIDGKNYCVTLTSEGAAGSIYNQYAYSFEMDGLPAQTGKTVKLTFTTRATQCANYPEAEKTECEQERAKFDVDGIANSIAKTIELK